LPLFEAQLSPASSNQEYDAAWAAAVNQARDAIGPVRTIAYGDLFLEDVRQFREEQATRLGYTPMFPLWGRDTALLAREFVAAGYEAYLTCVDTTQLAPEFAGRRFDAALLEALPPSVDPCGERGEFHTCVVAGPIFAFPIPVTRGERLRRENRFEYCDLLPGPDGEHG
jgi:diphthamide synthase (EF-2-diphthine--ammonia ligase)